MNSQAIAALVIGSGGRVHHQSATAKEYCPSSSAVARHLRQSVLARGAIHFSTAVWQSGRCDCTDCTPGEPKGSCISYHDMIPSWSMIRSFRGTLAALIFQQRRVPKGFPTDLAKVARRKLVN